MYKINKMYNEGGRSVGYVASNCTMALAAPAGPNLACDEERNVYENLHSVNCVDDKKRREKNRKKGGHAYIY